MPKPRVNGFWTFAKKHFSCFQSLESSSLFAVADRVAEVFLIPFGTLPSPKWFSNIVNSRWQISVADHFSKKRDQIGVESIRIVGGRPRGRPHSPKCDRIMSSKHTYSGWQITWQTTFIKFEPWRGVIFTKLQDTRGRPRGRPPADEKMQFPGLEPIWPLWAPWQTSWQSKCYDFNTF